MPRIFDNIEKELLPALQETIKLSQSKQQARETINRLLIQVGSDVYDPGWVNLSSLCGITIRDRTAVWPFSIGFDPIGCLRSPA
jgi:hypothetical protein